MTGKGTDYDPTGIERAWQERWAKDGLYETERDPKREKCYVLTMLPYPSGDLHMGHWYAMTPPDARARYLRMKGFNVTFPIGFDAFGLPAENAAIRHNTHPKEWTYSNIEHMREQLRSMGAMWDWPREAISADPSYYRWTQWFFRRLYGHGLAYRKRAPVDFCPTCNTTLAREQVWGEDRHCERCDTPVIKKDLAQWFFRITDYAEELLDFRDIDWPERVKVLQTNWIGRSEGAEVRFTTETGDDLVVFTTRPDTLWGATFMVLAPEHPLVEAITLPERRTAVDEYVAQARRQTDVEREAADREKTGVFTGGYAINPVNEEKIPVWIADYVLTTYGTGAIMAVPAHDQRDFEFARKYDLEIRPVIGGGPEAEDDPRNWQVPRTDPGPMINSGPLTGTPAEESLSATLAYLESDGRGSRAVNYRLHDWLISRQRYWGAPIPIVYCETCGVVPVPEGELPVLLPDDIEWRPTGESPLKYHPTWRHTQCPECSGAAERETDTMDTFMCSSWYQYRYLSPQEESAPWSQDELDYWMPVDVYTGGIEHATMHLIYTRFFTKALRDMKLVDFDEPMLQLRIQGTILGEDGEKMSKNRGNVVAPDQLVATYGADALRAFLMFFARWEQGGPWSSTGIEGVHRWLKRVWKLYTESPSDSVAGGEGSPKEGRSPKSTQRLERELKRKVHQTIERVSHDLEHFEFNTVISALMELTNQLVSAKAAGATGAAFVEGCEVLLKLMAPVTPHVAEELWQRLGGPYSIHTQPWPEADAEAAAEEEVTLVIQINGKVRDKISVPPDLDEETARAKTMASEAVQRHLAGRTPKKIIYVPGRLMNLVA